MLRIFNPREHSKVNPGGKVNQACESSHWSARSLCRVELSLWRCCPQASPLLTPFFCRKATFLFNKREDTEEPGDVCVTSPNSENLDEKSTFLGNQEFSSEVRWGTGDEQAWRQKQRPGLGPSAPRCRPRHLPRGSPLSPAGAALCRGQKQLRSSQLIL